MTKVETVTCRECGWKGTVAHCEPIAPRYLPGARRRGRRHARGRMP